MGTQHSCCCFIVHHKATLNSLVFNNRWKRTGRVNSRENAFLLTDRSPKEANPALHNFVSIARKLFCNARTV